MKKQSKQIKMMKKTSHLVIVLILLSSSCRPLNEPTHSSYATLVRFLKQENLYQTFDIEKVDVDFMSLADRKDYRPDNQIMHDRQLEATYYLTLTGRDKVYRSRATMASTDSVVWQMKTLVLKEKTDNSNTVTEKTYRWDLSRCPIRSVSTTKVTKG